MKSLPIAAALASAAFSANAVYLSPDGLGQALLFPYYTVQSAGPNAFNTYVTIANTTDDYKVLKVRFREGKNSRQVAEFNLYLGVRDSWAGVLFRDGEGVRLATRDLSCVNPKLPSDGLLFSNSTYAGGDDGAGTGLDRAREGHIEVIEMATLRLPIAAALFRPTSSGEPASCPAVQGPSVDLGQTYPPTGGLSGSATLINVANGMDFTYNADALASLTSTAFYSNPGQPGTDFDSAAVDRVSMVVAGDKVYRLTWNQSADAVSSALAAVSLHNDFVLDSGTASKTDWVLTFPTRRFYVTPTTASPPFAAPFTMAFDDCLGVGFHSSNREGITYDDGFTLPPAPSTRACWAANAFSIRGVRLALPFGVQSDVFGSRNVLAPLPGAAPGADGTGILAVKALENGQINMGTQTGRSLLSAADSTAMDLRTGAISQGAFYVSGAPVIGFMARTFENGTLTCGSNTCQGNYGGAFPHRRKRDVLSP
jgi:hypothetical protein